MVSAAAADVAVTDKFGSLGGNVPIETDRQMMAAVPTTRLALEVGLMLRDIDYAAQAVKTALAEKYGRENVLDDLQVTAGKNTICVQHADRTAEGTRDRLISCIHKSGSYDQFWRMCSESLSATPISQRR